MDFRLVLGLSAILLPVASEYKGVRGTAAITASKPQTGKTGQRCLPNQSEILRR